MKYIAGIDLGAGYTKCVVTDREGKVLSSAIDRTGSSFEKMSSELLDKCLDGMDRNDCYIITTGIGRYSVAFRNIQITEITATARGLKELHPDVEFILDVGAQVTRAMKINHLGQVKEFKCNEKCAAGSGSFIERAAKYLEIDIKDVGELSLYAKDPQPISSICAVLAESEIINHISEGKTVDNILRGVHESLSDRALMLLKRIGYKGGKKCALVGGLALQQGMVKALGDKIGAEVVLPENPRLVTAYGACLMALQRHSKVKQTDAV